jgi:hypothetical protein
MTGRPFVTITGVTAALAIATLSSLSLPAASHDWYSGLRAPDGSLCCSDRDCHELQWSEVRRSADGALELMIGGRWLPVPFEAILPQRSPNGHVHACWPPSGRHIRCVILPPEA